MLILGAYAINFAGERPEMEFDALMANPQNNVRVVAYKDRNSGLADLKSLAKSSKYEEMYAFFPNQNKWVELGHSETTSQKLEYDKQFLAQEFLKDQMVEIYHTHTQSGIDKELDNFEDAYARNGRLLNEEQISDGLVEITAHSGMPSNSDICNLIEDSKNLKINNVDNFLSHGVVTPNSVVNYSVLPKTYNKASCGEAAIANGLLKPELWSYNPVKSRRLDQLVESFNENTINLEFSRR